MAASNNERNKAARLRMERKANGALSPEKQAWLDTYEATYTGTRGTAPPARYVAPVAASAPVAAPNPAPPANAPTPAPTPVASGVPEGHTLIDFGAAQPQSSALVAPTTCGVPDCVACKGNSGARRCEATGKLVWPPMSPLAARTLASGILGLIALGVRFARRDKLFVMPNPKEIADMAAALLDIQRNHFTMLGAGYEFFALIGALGSYGRRAMTEPTPVKAPEVIGNAPE